MAGAAISPQLYCCPACKRDKPREAFGHHRGRVTGRAVYCLECERAKWRAGERMRWCVSCRQMHAGRNFDEDAGSCRASIRRESSEYRCSVCDELGHNSATCAKTREAQMTEEGLTRCPRCGAMPFAADFEAHVASCRPQTIYDIASRRDGSAT